MEWINYMNDAIDYIASQLLESDGIASFEYENSDMLSVVIIGLIDAGEDVVNGRFGNLVLASEAHQNENGSFVQRPDNLMASTVCSNVLRALDAVEHDSSAFFYLISTGNVRGADDQSNSTGAILFVVISVAVVFIVAAVGAVMMEKAKAKTERV